MGNWVFHLMLGATGCAAGVINSVAGCGPILTLGVLSLTGIDPRIANLTSTVALSPGQIVAGFAVRHRLREVRLGRPLVLIGIALAGGAADAALLLATTGSAFRLLVPWLVLLATAFYAASGRWRMMTRAGGTAQHPIASGLFASLAVYGGYFGGGNSFLMLALLALTGHDARLSGELKNILVAAINLGAVSVFAASGAVDWPVAASLGAGGILGSYLGAQLLGQLPVGLIRAIVIVGGLLLAAWLFAV